MADPTAIATMAEPVARRRLRVALIGWGAINARLGALIADRALPVDIVAVAVSGSKTPDPGMPKDAAILTDPADLAAHAPDLVVEAAGRAALELWAEAALRCCPTLICASTSAFTDDAFRHRLTQLAEAHGAQLVVTPGAIGGVDAIRAAAFLPVETLTHTVVKPPRAWKGTPAEAAIDLDAIKAPVTFFEGSARQAASLYPQNANATATTALAGIGLDATTVRLVADPGLTRNRHTITLVGEAGDMTITLDNAPCAHNPKSSELTALSLLRLIANASGTLLL